MQKVVIEDLMPGSKSGQKSNNEANHNKELLRKEMDKLLVPKMSFEKFAKGVKDKEALKMIKKQWKSFMKKNYPNWTAKSDFYTSKVTL